MQRDEMVRNSIKDVYVRGQDQSDIHKQHKQANNCNANAVSSPFHGGVLLNLEMLVGLPGFAWNSGSVISDPKVEVGILTFSAQASYLDLTK